MHKMRTYEADVSRIFVENVMFHLLSRMKCFNCVVAESEGPKVICSVDSAEVIWMCISKTHTGHIRTRTGHTRTYRGRIRDMDGDI